MTQEDGSNSELLNSFLSNEQRARGKTLKVSGPGYVVKVS